MSEQVSDVARLPSGDETRRINAHRLRTLDAAPYLASLLLSMPVLVVDNLPSVGIDTKARLYVGTDALDAWTPDQWVGALIHEAGHLLQGHAKRMVEAGRADVKRWNIAGDLTLNDALLGGGFELPPNGWTCDRAGVDHGHTVETYYDLVELDDEPDSHTCGSGAGGQPGAWELGNDDPTLPDPDGNDVDVPGLSDFDQEMIQRQVASDIMDDLTDSQVGNIPVNLERWAAATLAPPVVSWRKLLISAIQRPLRTAAGTDDYTFSRMNRRRRHRRLIIPATHNAEPTLAVIVDTSGSISDAMNVAFVSEVAGLGRQFNLHPSKIDVIACDTKAHPPVSAQHLIRGAPLRGGGGTDLRNGLAAVEELAVVPDVVIVFTDGLTRWPTEPGAVPVVVALRRPARGPGPKDPPDWMTVVDIPSDGLA